MLRRLWQMAGVALAMAALAPPASAFNPEGRSKKPKAGQKKPAQPVSKAPGAAAAPTAKLKETPSAAEATSSKGPSHEVLIARYLGIALSQPGADFPLERLVELYRERDGNLEGLVSELSVRFAAAGTDGKPGILLALGGVFKRDGQIEKAIGAFERASAIRPEDPGGTLAVARLLEERGDKAGARARYEAALPKVKDPTTKEQLLRTLRGLLLDEQAFERAKQVHEELVRVSRGSFFVRAELGRDLENRGEFVRAASEYQAVVKAAAGDNRVLSSALLDYGRALSKAGRDAEARATFDRALESASRESGARRQILTGMADLARRTNQLPALVARLEKTARGADELRSLAELYEETGQVDKALAMHRKVLGQDAKDLATRLRVVRLLEARGDIDEAFTQYDALIKSAPRNPDYVFRLSEALLQRGDRKRALATLRGLETRAQGDEQTLSALVEAYERMGESERALELLQRLAQNGSQDPEHVIGLGSRYWEQGDKARALATWQRLRTLGADRALGLVRLGEVYLEHELTQEALAVFAEAVLLAPKQPRIRRAQALGLERSAAAGVGQRVAYDEARKIWETLLLEEWRDVSLTREARQHVVTMLTLTGQLGPRLLLLERKFAASPADLPAGRLLSEGYLRQRRYADAERVLRRLNQLAPGDVEDLTRLERVLVLSKKLEGAIETLERLSKLDPKRSREYLQRMAGYAAELYQDDRALEYAARAVELGPDDAYGHKKLGEMYQKRQDTTRAIAEYRSAILKNDRLFVVYLELGELLLGQGALDEADQLFRRVLRSAPDEELVYKAARLSIQLNLGQGTLESLERELLPLALGSGERPIHRRLLVEVYGALAYPLLQQLKSENANEAAAAREGLQRLGERAVKPLLDALADPREAQQQIALTLLTHVANKDAAPALFAYATGAALPQLRVRAMIAVGALRDPRLVAKLAELSLASSDEDGEPLRVATAWALARSNGASSAALRKLAATGDGSARALGLLGLAEAGDKQAAPIVHALLASNDAGALPRAAAAFAAGQLHLGGEHEQLQRLTSDADPSVRAQAMLALARLGRETALGAIADALSGPVSELQQAGARAAVVLVRKPAPLFAELLPVPDGPLDVRALLDGLRPLPHDPSLELAAFEHALPTLAKVMRTSAEIAPERARALGEALSGDGFALGSFVTASRMPTAEEQAASRRLQSTLGAALLEPLIKLTRQPDPETRLVPLAFLLSRSEPAAEHAISLLVRDPEPAVRRALFATLGPAQRELAPEIAARLAEEPDWALRTAAAEALGRVAAGTNDDRVSTALSNLALVDAYALVREAALRSLYRVAPAKAAPILERSKSTDPEPRLRKVAAELQASGTAP